MTLRTLNRLAAVFCAALITPTVFSGPVTPASLNLDHPDYRMLLARSILKKAGPDDPYADQVISYNSGTNAAPGFLDSLTTLGIPERFTGEGIFPSAVTVFNSPFGTDEIVSIGEGGSLIVKFNTPVTDDPDNLFGIDLLVFGNALFAFGGSGVGNPAGLFSEPGIIEVSVDGTTWFTVADALADDLFPTEGYRDLTDPFATTPGSVESNFTQPVDPALSLADFSGLTYAQVLEIYNGSGGGAGVDIGALGLSEISFVRISNPVGSGITPEIDGFADVAPRIPGDVDLDGQVNVTDLLKLLGAWGARAPGDPPADFNNDGLVNVTDLLTLLGNWG